MPEFTLRADGIPFRVTADSREAAAAALGEALDNNPEILQQKAEQLGLSEDDVASLRRQSRGEEAEDTVDVGTGLATAALATGESILEGAIRLPEMARQLAWDTFGSEEDAQAVWREIQSDRAARQDEAERRATRLLQDDAAVDALLADFDENAELGQAALVTAVTAGLGSAMQGARGLNMGRQVLGRGIKDTFVRRTLGSGARLVTDAAKAGASGAAGGATVGVDGETVEERQAARLENMKLGAAIGAGATVGIGTLGGLRKAVLSPLRRAMNEGEGAQLALQRAAEDRGTFVSMGQRTGSNFLLGLEDMVSGTAKNRTLRDQADNLMNSTRRLLRGTGAGSTPQYGTAVRTVGRTLDERVREMEKLKRKTWQDGMKRVERLVIEEGAPSVQPGSLRAVMDDIRADMSKASLTDLELSPGFSQLYDDISNSLRSGGATPSKINDWLQTIEFGTNGTMFTGVSAQKATGLNKAYINKMRTALMDDIGRLEQTGRRSRAIDEMLKVRDDYRQLSDDLRFFEDETALGMMRNPKNAEQAIRNIAKLDDEGQRVLRDTLRATNPALHDELSGLVLRKAIDDSFVSRGSQLRRFDLNKFRNNLRVQAVPGQPGARTSLRGFLNDDDIRNADEAAELASRMMNLGESVARQNVTLGDIAINVISRSAEFAGRLVTRMVTGGKSAEWLFFSPEGNRWMRRMVQAQSRNDVTTMNTLAFIGGHALGTDQEPEPEASLAEQLGVPQ